MGYTIEDAFITSSRDGYKISISIYKLDGVKRRMPTVVMAHGIGAIKAAGLSPFAGEFTSEGYAAVTFDYVGFGASGGTPRNVLDVRRQLQDLRDVVGWARAPEQAGWVDDSRIVAWGSSFGGMHTTALMAEDRGLAAGIAQCPLVDGRAAAVAMPLGRSLRLAAAAVADVAGSYLPGAREPRYVDLVSDGSTTAVMASKEAAEGWARLTPRGGEEWPNIIAGRSLLSIMTSRPLLQVHMSTRPYLIVLPTWDHEASLDAAEECVRRAPRGECLWVQGGHFDLYEGGVAYEKNIAGQKLFLRRVLRQEAATG
ncbi:putative 31.7 kDa protein in traX-finO intergenic region [Colletotrichum tanaceti]|uniref:Putative 31.7 kDa protein in traX-finO intergenic region n=1 Tax=Colletotrichum tanaceti TaxID=1306861 RepID=A0A4U6XQW7_9PEZI|nr:putative 31.7 kDa protein in traX-finO intergenic region [Colletotrichum tanaceti]TKW58069.1 putative 31.7 kDa protein in traX-finO intergenic region [Colletotrichum tanaceti]